LTAVTTGHLGSGYAGMVRGYIATRRGRPQKARIG
jgi:hypothetical protein